MSAIFSRPQCVKATYTPMYLWVWLLMNLHMNHLMPLHYDALMSDFSDVYLKKTYIVFMGVGYGQQIIINDEDGAPYINID